MGKKAHAKYIVCSIVVSALAVLVVLCSIRLNCAWSIEKDTTVSEYEVKAAFLLNFIRFVEWPDETAGKPADELVLCIAGKDPFGQFLDLIKDRTIRGRRLVIEQYYDASSLANCHILFVPASEKERLSSLLAESEDLHVLTIGEIQGFAQMGGIINFVIAENRIRFEINPDAAKRAGLKISSQLLKLARIVRG